MCQTLFPSTNKNLKKSLNSEMPVLSSLYTLLDLLRSIHSAASWEQVDLDLLLKKAVSLAIFSFVKLLLRAPLDPNRSILYFPIHNSAVALLQLLPFNICQKPYQMCRCFLNLLLLILRDVI